MEVRGVRVILRGSVPSPAERKEAAWMEPGVLVVESRSAITRPGAKEQWQRHEQP
jgi:putative N-acetylmannosamine-6-phosphate epimerase